MKVLGGLRRIARGEAHFDFVGRAKIWMVASGVVLVASLGGLFIRELNLGLAFRGGSSFSVPVAPGHVEPTVRAVQDALDAVGVSDAQVQIVRSTGGGRNILAQARHVGDQKAVSETLARLGGQVDAGVPNVNAVSVQDVGPKWGRQISRKAVQGVILFLILVVIYISIRFEPKMAGAAFLALFHDLLATAGIYALVGFEVTPATVIAILTILGYSLYDTVVVFDKVKENTATLTGASRVGYGEMVNRSVNQVLMRSINTSLTSLIPAAGLLFVGAFLLGAETLKDLALALFIGIGVGTYSSIFIAAPVLALWKEREPRYQQMRSRVRPGGRVVPVAVGASTAGAPTVEEETVEARAPYRPQLGNRPPPRPRRRKRGKRRR
jgi:preprotein translocase subunit SecF